MKKPTVGYLDFVRQSRQELRIFTRRVANAKTLTELRKAYEASPILLSADLKTKKYRYEFGFTLMVFHDWGEYVAETEYDNSELEVVKAFLLGACAHYEQLLDKTNHIREVER